MIGPDVADSEALLPNMPVEIEIPTAGVKGEFMAGSGAFPAPQAKQAWREETAPQ